MRAVTANYPKSGRNILSELPRVVGQGPRNFDPLKDIKFPAPCWRPGVKGNVFLLFFLLAVSACNSIGPHTIPRDRFNYDTAIGESWKRQILLNIIRLRYLDPPTFVDVGQIVSGYTLESGFDVMGQGGSGDLGGSFGNLGGHITFTDRPTITYTPLTGSRYMHGLMTPISPESLFYTIDSGWPADAILKMGVSSINGLRNEEITISGYRPPDPKFLRAVLLLREIQKSGSVAMKILVDKEQHETNIITFRSASATAQTLQDIAECRQLLGLSPQAMDLQLVYGTGAANDHEIAVQTRSLLHIMDAVAARAEVPPEDIRDGRVMPGAGSEGDLSTQPGEPSIRYSDKEPGDAFAAVEYRRHWFWVDDRNLEAKRNLAFMMLLFTLADTGQQAAAPLVTIPAQ